MRRGKEDRLVIPRHNSWPMVVLILVLLGLSTPIMAWAQDVSQPTAVAPTVGAGQPSSTVAPAPAKIDKGDTAWILTSSALVLMMTIPGLFLFYGGLVRRKNVLGTIMHSFIIVAL